MQLCFQNKLHDVFVGLSLENYSETFWAEPKVETSPKSLRRCRVEAQKQIKGDFCIKKIFWLGATNYEKQIFFKDLCGILSSQTYASNIVGINKNNTHNFKFLLWFYIFLASGIPTLSICLLKEATTFKLWYTKAALLQQAITFSQPFENGINVIQFKWEDIFNFWKHQIIVNNNDPLFKY